MLRRNTVQKNLVLAAVTQLKSHATADEVYRAVKEEAPSVSKATVYRNLNVLAEEGAIRKVEVPGDADRFDHNTGAHCHVRCVRCGRLFDLKADVLPEITAHLQGTQDFTLLSCEVVFKGICSECTRKEAQAR